MLTWTRNGVVILLLIGLLQDVARVEGLECYECPFGCTTDELKGKEKECPSGITSCQKTHLDGSEKAHRTCAISFPGLQIDNQCKKADNGKGEVCFCDTKLCNGAKSTRTPSTLITTVALIFSLPVISAITGRKLTD